MILTDAELASLTEAVTQALGESDELAKAAGLDRADIMLRITHAAQDILTHAETIRTMDPADRDESVAKWTENNPLRKAVWDTLGRKVIGAAQGAADAYMASASKAGAVAQQAGRKLANRLAAANAKVAGGAAYQRAAAPHYRRALAAQLQGRGAAREQALNAAISSGRAARTMAEKLSAQRDAPMVRATAKLAGRIGVRAYHTAAGLGAAGAGYAGYRMAHDDRAYRKADAGDLGKGIASAAGAAERLSLSQVANAVRNGIAPAADFTRAHLRHLNAAAHHTGYTGVRYPGAQAVLHGAGIGALAGGVMGGDVASGVAGGIAGAMNIPILAATRHGAFIGRRLGGRPGALAGAALGAAAYPAAGLAAYAGYKTLTEKQHQQRVDAARASAEKRRKNQVDKADAGDLEKGFGEDIRTAFFNAGQKKARAAYRQARYIATGGPFGEAMTRAGLPPSKGELQRARKAGRKAAFQALVTHNENPFPSIRAFGHYLKNKFTKADDLPLDALYKAAPAELQDDLALLPASVQEQALADLREILIEFDDLAKSLEGASLEKIEATVTDYMLTGDVELKKFLPALLAGAGGLIARAAPYAVRAIGALRSGATALSDGGAALASRAGRIAGNPALGMRYGSRLGHAAMTGAAKLPGQAAYGARVGYRFGRAKIGQALRSSLAQRLRSAAPRVGRGITNGFGLAALGTGISGMLPNSNPKVT